MPFTQNQLEAARNAQHQVAHDDAAQVRLLAGPGTGKSASIEERVHWLLDNGVQPHQIVAVSFTRAAARDLERRIRLYGEQHGHGNVDQVRVSTLHSVALRILRQAGLLNAFPVEPRVLDDWELSEIFDAEFGRAAGIARKDRREAIRRAWEAFWSSGVWNPANYIPPDPPITQHERNSFSAFLTARGQLYACVLPGEIVRRCVDHANAGVLDLPGLFGATHLIVDEYQDLNACDQQFVRLLAQAGITLFIAGDDDQSIYSFRFASPSGIQTFQQAYPNASMHALDSCFRCTPVILDSAYSLVEAFPDPLRLPKHVSSLYGNAAPPVVGVTHRWRFNSSASEATAIAQSCRALIDAGVGPQNIMILLSSVPTLGGPICAALQELGVPFRAPRAKPFSDSPEGRLGQALVRFALDTNDYIALRTIVGIRRGVGIGTCNAIADAIHGANLNYRNVFVAPLPEGVFTTRMLRAINPAREIAARLQDWAEGDTLADRRADLVEIITASLREQDAVAWGEATAALPNEMVLKELVEWLRAPSEADRQRILSKVAARLNGDEQDVPAEDALDPVVQVMTMHTAKGLSAEVVFVPGLEEQLLPGPRRAPFPGLVSEAARLLFVSMTRARAACIASFTTTRFTQGANLHRTASRFCQHLGGPFLPRNGGLTAQEVGAITGFIANLY